jgi:hypothetical protein
MIPNRQTPRILRNLQIAEVSGVRKGAGHGVQIKLMKQEAAMQTEFTKADALQAWNQGVDETVRVLKVNRSRAVDHLLRNSETAQRLWNIVKGYSASDVLEKDAPVESPTKDRGHGDSSNYSDPHRSTRNVVDPNSVVGRLRGEHGSKGLAAFNGLVDAHVASGMSRSMAMDRVRRERPELWQQAKAA